jgi:alkylated DNA repair dioxygenase AlkB
MQQLNLFQQIQPQKIDLPKSDIILFPNFFSQKESDEFYQELLIKIPWQQDYINLYGRRMPIPRKTAWYGEFQKNYTYSGITMIPNAWTEILLLIKSKIECQSETIFNSVLLNLYRDGKDSVAWHSDDEAELGENPIIGSVSFGGERSFRLKPKDKFQKNVKKIFLTHGSFLLMKGETQKYWLHEVPKTAKPVSPRINLTFRVIKNN